MKKITLTLQALAAPILAVLLLPVSGFAHALLVSPVPRDFGTTAADIIDTAGNETAPCAPNLAVVPCATTANPALCTFTAGQAIPVTFEAVIQHNGPFTLSLGPAAATSATPQASFTTLLSPATAPTTPFVQTEAQNANGTFTEVQKNNVSTTTPDVYKEYVVIPASTAPGNYTLQLQQGNAPVTYYTCSDITITATATPSPTPSASPSPSPSVMPSVSPSPSPTGTGPLGTQGLGTTPGSNNSGAQMASCGLVREIGNSNGPGRGPGAAALIISLPLMMFLMLAMRARREETVRVRSRRS